jgi:ethylbenzene dioxygenase subunit beta
VTSIERTAVELFVEVTAFLNREARLLDQESYVDWLELFTDDAHYWVPGIENRARRDPARAPSPTYMAYFDDTVADLRRRVARLTSSTAWAEDPPTRHLHVVSNIEVHGPDALDELAVASVFVNYRGQSDVHQTTLYGRREDKLRRVDGQLRIAQRHVFLRHNVLPAKNINTFF